MPEVVVGVLIKSLAGVLADEIVGVVPGIRAELVADVSVDGFAAVIAALGFAMPASVEEFSW